MPTAGALSAEEARWVALRAQRLDRPLPARRPGPGSLSSLVEHLGAVQLDAVNVLARSHEIVPFSRLGDHRGDLRGLTGPGGPLYEYWGHAASLLPVTLEPLFRWRTRLAGPWSEGSRYAARQAAWVAEHADYLDAVRAEVRERGPLTAGELSDPRRRDGEWWGRRSLGRQALEHLFFAGEVAGWRNAGFERVYDLTDRVLPHHVLASATPSIEDAHRALLVRAAGALGVGTVGDLADYFRLKTPTARPRIAELVEGGDLVAVAVEGWTEPGYALPGFRVRRPVRPEATLLSPFDSLVWERARTQRIFGFDYRIEIYVPAAKRRHGYFVLPVLLGDRLVARVDLKADRTAGVLRVRAAHAEEGTEAAAAAEAIAAELARMAVWRGLGSVAVELRGDLARPLRDAARRAVGRPGPTAVRGRSERTI
jgi:uncharacterized protein YcaQ